MQIEDNESQPNTKNTKLNDLEKSEGSANTGLSENVFEAREEHEEKLLEDTDTNDEQGNVIHENTEANDKQETISGIQDQIMGKLNEIEARQVTLEKEFQSKIKYDQHKETIIDNLHRELQAYKDDFKKQMLKPVILDIIQTIDSLNKMVKHYSSQNNSNIDPEKLLGVLEDVPSDLEDILYRQGVEPYQCEDDHFHPERQRILKTKVTDSESLDKSIAERARKGYEWEGKILRQEMVEVYKFKS